MVSLARDPEVVKVKVEPLPGVALDPDAPAVQLDELARERQAEAGAFLLVRVVAADLAELLEHRLLVLRRDADAGVAHGDLDARRRRARARDVDRARRPA